MTPLVRKFGRFLLVSVNDEKDAMGLFSSETRNVKEIKNISSYLKKISGKYLLLATGEEKITCDELSMRRLLKISEKGIILFLIRS